MRPRSGEGSADHSQGLHLAAEHFADFDDSRMGREPLDEELPEDGVQGNRQSDLREE